MSEPLEAENSEEDIDDGMDFGKMKNSFSPDKAMKKKQAIETYQTGTSGPVFHKGKTMYINGKPIKVNNNNQALNKREKSNWLIHLLFIRQDYSECLKFVDELLEESERKQDGERSEYALYLKALILRIKGNIHESL